MKQSKPKSRQFGAAATFVDQRLALGRVAFPLADLVRATGLSVTAARNQLLRLKNRVTRVSPRHQFFVKRTVEQTPTQPLANAFAPLQVSTPEATTFDLIRYAARIGGIGRAAETIAPLLPLMRPTELRRVLKIENEASTAQRLGFVLEKLKATNLTKVVQDWLPSNLIFVPLVPGLRGDAPEVKHWKILNNGKIDEAANLLKNGPVFFNK